MRKPNTDHWKLPLTTGLLLFAQCLEELLFDYTLDSYKSRALNTHTRCLELLQTISDVKSGVIHQKTLGPIVDELAHSVSNDFAAKSLLGPRAISFANSQWWNIANLDALRVQGELLEGKLRQRLYEAEIIRILRDIIPAAKRKDDIISLASDLVVEWMYLGFSRSYIYFMTREFFFKGRLQINDVSELDRFLKWLEPIPRKWDVCMRVNKALLTLGPVLSLDNLELVETPPRCRSDSDREKEFLKAQHEGAYCVLRDVEALDARAANIQAVNQLAVLWSMASFHVHKTSLLSLEDDVLVWEKNTSTVLQPPTRPVHMQEECRVEQLAQRLKRTVDALNPDNINDGSWVRIEAAFGLHASALGSSEPSVQLSSLWAALESLIPSSLEDSRIGTIIDVVAPMLSVGYAAKLFSDLDKSLHVCCPGLYDSIQRKLGSSGNHSIACTEIVCIQSNKSFMEELLAGLDGNPLLRHRIFRLHESFSRSDHILESIRLHQRRVEWHLRRIYRSRNLLLHAGRSLLIRESLVENLHSYFKQIMIRLEDVYSRTSSPVSLDAAFYSIGLEHSAHLDFLKASGKTNCDSSNIECLLYGQGI